MSSVFMGLSMSNQLVLYTAPFQMLLVIFSQLVHKEL